MLIKKHLLQSRLSSAHPLPSLPFCCGWWWCGCDDLGSIHTWLWGLSIASYCAVSGLHINLWYSHTEPIYINGVLPIYPPFNAMLVLCLLWFILLFLYFIIFNFLLRPMFILLIKTHEYWGRVTCLYVLLTYNWLDMDRYSCVAREHRVEFPGSNSRAARIILSTCSTPGIWTYEQSLQDKHPKLLDSPWRPIMVSFKIYPFIPISERKITPIVYKR